MLSHVVLVMFAVTATDATFFHKRHLKHHFTVDMNGFHNHNHGFTFHKQNEHFAPSPPVYGPPPFPPHFDSHRDRHQHTPQCNHQLENGFDMMPIPYTPNTDNMMPFIPNMNHPMPFIPNMNHPMPFFPSMNNPIPSFPTGIYPFNLGPNFPFNPQYPFNTNPNQVGGNIPSNTVHTNNFGFDSVNNNNPVENPTNLPADTLSTSNTNTMTPLDANMSSNQNGQSSRTPNIEIDEFNGNNQPQNSSVPSQTAGSVVIYM